MAALYAMTLLLLMPGVTARAAEPSPPRYSMELKEAWIPLPNGVRLAADLYMPRGAAAGDKFPVLLEYLPYRKTEARVRNWPMYSYFVERGYVIARVDTRGTGNSEGTLVPHEYSDIELVDGESVIDWLSRQSWSNGNVGMFGISWGGFNAIQLAGRGPPDYVMDEAYFGDRFDTPPWMLTWKREQRDGPFWDRASWRGRQSEIKVPGFHIGGWYDGYRDSLPRMLQHASGPVKALIGPWSHALPHEPYPKPGMEWRHEAVRCSRSAPTPRARTKMHVSPTWRPTAPSRRSPGPVSTAITTSRRGPPSCWWRARPSRSTWKCTSRPGFSPRAIASAWR